MSEQKSTSCADAEQPKLDAERRTLVGLMALAIAWPSAVGATASKLEGDKSMSAETILAVVSRYADAWLRNDVPVILDSYHPDFTLHYPGDHKLAGTHVGKTTSFNVMTEVSRITNRSLIEIVSVMAGDERGAIIARERWRREGEEAIVERVLVYSVLEGRLRDCWLFDADQKVVERFLG